MGREEALEERLIKGMLATEIQKLQQLLGEQVSTLREFLAPTQAELEQTRHALQTRLRDRQSPGHSPGHSPGYSPGQSPE